MRARDLADLVPIGGGALEELDRLSLDLRSPEAPIGFQGRPGAELVGEIQAQIGPGLDVLELAFLRPVRPGGGGARLTMSLSASRPSASKPSASSSGVDEAGAAARAGDEIADRNIGRIERSVGDELVDGYERRRALLIAGLDRREEAFGIEGEVPCRPVERRQLQRHAAGQGRMPSIARRPG